VTEIFVVNRCDACWNGFRQYLSAVINVECICKLETGAWGYYGVQVNHGTALLPHECTEKAAAIRGTANNLASCIDRSATTARIATNRSKIQNRRRKGFLAESQAPFTVPRVVNLLFDWQSQRSASEVLHFLGGKHMADLKFDKEMTSPANLSCYRW